MKRRSFFEAAGVGVLGLLTAPRSLLAQVGVRSQGKALEGVDPYYLQSGNLTPEEEQDVLTYMEYLEKASEGVSLPAPRGKPKRAPTYRFVHWEGDIANATGRFVGPLSVRPMLPPEDTYSINAQILNFHAASDDWPGEQNVGTLTIEVRTRIRGESLTWMYAEQFELYEGGYSSLGLEYIGQRDGVPTPMGSDEPNMDIRVQLIRNKKKGGGLLGKVFKVASYVVGGAAAPTRIAQLAPPMRVPQMVKEGVALSQAVFGAAGDQAPVWRSGFTSFGIAQGGSRLGLQPGLWVILDASRQVDLRGVRLEDMGGRVGLTRQGQELDINYLVLALELSEGRLPDLYYGSGSEQNESEDRGVIKKGKP